MAAPAPDDVREVVLQAESAVSATIFSTAPSGHAGGYPQTPGIHRHAHVESGAAALLAAAGAAQHGHRAAAALSPAELLGALEALHSVARGRAPIVVHVLPPTLGGGDPGSQRTGREEIAPALDAGAGVLVTWSAQESVDLTLAARRAAEDAETPFVLITDGGGPVMALPGSGLISKFLGATRAARPGTEAITEAAPEELDANQRHLKHLRDKRAERSFAARVPFALAGAMRELGELTSRPLAPVERYQTADAEEIVVAVGQAYPAARAAAEGLRREGRRVGAVGVRVLRPFFPAELVKAVSRARAIAVIEPLDIALAPCGPLATSLKAAFADAITWAPGFPGVGRIPPIVSVVFATLDGGVTELQVREALRELGAGDRARRLIAFGSDG
jgi:pyruvate ferredoxin oxidoreductase alpha subunit